MRQSLQLHSQTTTSEVGVVHSKRTAPQWHPPLCVVGIDLDLGAEAMPDGFTTVESSHSQSRLTSGLSVEPPARGAALGGGKSFVSGGASALAQCDAIMS